MTDTTNSISVDSNGRITATNLTLGKNITTGSSVGDENNPNYIQVDYFKVTNDTIKNNMKNNEFYVGNQAGIGGLDPVNGQSNILYTGLTGSFIDKSTKKQQVTISLDNRGFFAYSSITGEPDENSGGYARINFDSNSGYGYGAFYFKPTVIKKEQLSNLSFQDDFNVLSQGAILAVSNWYSDNDNFVTYILYNNGDYTPITPNLNVKSTNFLQDEVPTSATSTGTKGATAFDRNYMYHCYADNQWTRFARDLSW